MRELFIIRVLSGRGGVAGSPLAVPYVFDSWEAAHDYATSNWLSLSAAFPGIREGDILIDTLFEIPYHM